MMTRLLPFLTIRQITHASFRKVCIFRVNDGDKWRLEDSADTRIINIYFVPVCCVAHRKLVLTFRIKKARLEKKSRQPLED